MTGEWEEERRSSFQSNELYNISDSLAIAWPYCIYKDKESLSYMITYRKIPKISPGAYIFQRPFLRDLFLEGLLFHGAYLMREICIS